MAFSYPQSKIGEFILTFQKSQSQVYCEESENLCLIRRLDETGAGVAQLVSARFSELAGRQFNPHHSIEACFDFPLFRVAVALNTHEMEH